MSLSSKIHIVNTARIVIATRKQKALSVSLPFNIKAITKGGNNMEIWKDIEGYEGLYQVSTFGNVRSLNYRHHGGVSVLHQYKLPQGYMIVYLYKNKKGKMFYVHRLVGQTFLENHFNYPEINHINEKQWDNRVENLEWCSSKYNTNYSREKHPERYFTTIDGKRTLKTTKYSAYEVHQKSLEGQIIKTWNNIAEIVRELGYSNSPITRCCLGMNKTAYGYKWEFADKSASSFFIDSSRETR